jgi:membrane-bound serine protease (ClpP class)
MGLAFASAGSPASVSTVIRVTLSDDIINPVVSRYIARGIDRATDSKAQCLLLQMDTPGGLMSSTKEITSRIMNARVPVVVYVAPRGAGAVSAGVFITMASHVAAMMPGTHIGAAHPVPGGGGGDEGQQLSKVMSQKWENYAASYVRGMAEERHRNVKWVEQAVRKSVSATADEALKLNVVDLIAEDTSDLLAKIDGRKVKLAASEVTLATKGAKIQDVPLTWQEQLLSRLAHPNIAYVLWLLALYGLIHELTNPGAIWPGVIGGVCLILALFAFSALPINWAGAALIVLGVGLMLADIKVPSHGALTAGGVMVFLLGSLMLVQADIPALRVSLPVILTMAAASVGFFAFAISYGIRAQLNKVSTGREGMVGLSGKARTALDPEGTVFVRGEYWNAHAPGGSIAKGEKVRVVEVDGMELTVEALSAK